MTSLVHLPGGTYGNDTWRRFIQFVHHALMKFMAIDHLCISSRQLTAPIR